MSGQIGLVGLHVQLNVVVDNNLEIENVKVDQKIVKGLHVSLVFVTHIIAKVRITFFVIIFVLKMISFSFNY